MLGRMEIHTFDAIVVGAGIAGATVAAHLSADRAVGLIEAEEQAGYHSTGRSAAIWYLNYGPPDVRVLTGLSRPFFENPPPGFTDTPLMSRRPVMFVAPEDQLDAMAAFLATSDGMLEISPERARDMIPALRPGYARAAAIEPDSFDMDVATLHQGFLRRLRAAGGTLALRSRTGRIERADGVWRVTVTSGDVFTAPILVNTAGAWGDEVAVQAGARPLGLTPKRRTGVIIDPTPWRATDWPMLHDAGNTFYARAEARSKMMVSPADETDQPPHDVRPDELDVALAIDRLQQALDIEVRRVEHSWAGLRTFTPDRNLAFGWDGEAEGFFWCVGQGGYGIQTSPAAGALVADVIAGRDPGAAARILPNIDPNRFRAAPT
jgi:D-arginine dehydrogenase